VTIEELTSKEDDGTGDVTISFKFKEYVKPKIYKSGTGKSSKKSSKKSTRKSSTRTTKVASKSTTYTVKKGDCLSRIAQAQTGNSSNWRTIYSDNKTVIGSNPNLIKIGQKLKIRASY
jgi:nucleoid-associated protein YgaU